MRDIERRSEPRRGLATRVGLAIAATGIMTAATVARAMASAVPDWRDTVAFGAAIVLLVAATPRRPLPRAVWLALAALAVALTARSGGSPFVVAAYVVVAALATWATAAVHLRPLTVGAYALAAPAVFWLFTPLPPGPALALASGIAIGAATRALVARERMHPSERLRRTGLAIAAIALVTLSLSRTLVIAGPGGALLDLVTLAAVLLLVALGELRIRAPLRELLATLTILTAFTLHGVAYLAGTPYGNDAVAAQHHAAELLLAGEHPYAAFDVRDALERFGLDPRLGTHLEGGDVVRGYSYPALSFLAVAPFVAAGLADIRWIDLAILLALAIVATRRTRPAWRPVVLAAIVGSDVVVRQSVLAGVDPLWALLVVLAWAARGSLWSGALMGLALADRQLAWFVFPFFLLAAGRARVAAVAIGVALAVQLPFLITAPGPTLAGVLAPLVAPIVADGVGLMQIGVTDRYLPALPRVVFTLVSSVLFVALVALAWRWRRRLATASLVWPFVPLFFAWRSLQNYFAFMPLLALVADDEVELRAEDAAQRGPVGPDREHDREIDRDADHQPALEAHEEQPERAE